MRTPALMIQGTGSNAGKSTLVAGLARALVRRGLTVAPFKPQNMSNNAAVTVDGGEIGRAQAVQARAARMPPSVHMNPVLLKPETDTGAQVIVQGKRRGTLHASAFRNRESLLPAVLESFNILAARADIVLVEGAGSPAETNLRKGDIANMGFAEAADVPVVLVGDIDRGGVIASLAGTHLVLPDHERARIRGFIINKFRGDVSLFDDGLTEIARRTGWPSIGVVPWLPQAAWLPAEDAVDLDRKQDSSPCDLDRKKDGSSCDLDRTKEFSSCDLDRAGSTPNACVIAVPMLSRIANFDDLDPLGMEPGVMLRFIKPGEAIPGDATVVILPGSKSTIGDLAFLRAQGWDIDIRAHLRRGGRVLGLCGGYQMLGASIDDPDGVDGRAGRVDGLGLLDIATVMRGDKSTTLVRGTHLASGTAITGYEIHLGQTAGADCARPLLIIDDRPDGAISRDGRVQGTYVHGLFAGDAFRRAWLADLGIVSALAYETRIDTALDALADHLEAHLDIDALLAIARRR